MIKLKTLTLSSALATGLAAGGAYAGDCGEVSITEMDWDSARVVTAISKFLMQEGYGCSVTTVPSASNPALASLAETGKPDVLTEIWTNGAPAYNGLIDSGKIKQLTEVLSDGGVEGWWVPNYMLEANPELATIEGILANPALVGNRFHNCPEGWTCKVVSTNMAKAAGFSDAGIEDFVHGSGETLAASIASAYENKEPWFGYYWAPTSILGKYPMTQVDIGAHDATAHECNSKDDCATPKLGSFPRSIVTTVVSDTFAAENPAVVELMTNLSISNAQMGELLAWMEDNNASGDEVAVRFLTTQQDTWKNWINDEARGKLAALLK